MEIKEKRIPQLANNKADCCGCGICSLLCPVTAIEMLEDDEGFLYPVIDEDKCIGCHSCIKNCAFSLRKEFVRENRKFNI